jgi:hypothetical protein
MMMRALLAIALAACTEHVQLGSRPGDPIPNLVALEVTPAETTLAIDDLAAPPEHVAFTALGTFKDGSARDVTDLVAWSTDNVEPGSFGVIAASTYTTSRAAGGHVAIAATAGTIAGEARLSVIVTVTIVDSTNPPPAGADALFAPSVPVVTGDPMRSPSILYPAHETVMPQGLVATAFQYTRGMDNDAIRIRFESDVLHLAVLTGNDRWHAEGIAWDLIARSHPAGAVTITVDGASSMMPGTIYRSAPNTLGFGRDAIDGVIYYFSDAADGVMRGLLEASTAAQLFPPPGDNGCTGCHTVSRDGRTMALGHGAERLTTLEIESLAPMLTRANDIPMGWATFSPDGQVLVADKGTLTLRDASSGLGVGPDNGRIRLPMHLKATHPDWSPAGDAVAITVADMVGNMDLKGGSIAVLRFAGGEWSDPQILVQSTGDNDNNYFPKWSPDGRYLAYVHADSASRGAKNAELRMIAAAGGTPIVLARANTRVGRTDDVPALANTMPSWAPLAGDLGFLAFASTRPYGAVRPAKDPSQIWITAVDLARGDGGDPSSAAFWLPCQDITSLANNPIWAPPKGAGGEPQ